MTKNEMRIFVSEMRMQLLSTAQSIMMERGGPFSTEDVVNAAKKLEAYVYNKDVTEDLPTLLNEDNK